MFSRRRFVALSALFLPHSLHAAPRRLGTLPAALAWLETTNGGRIGVAVLDTATGERAAYRANERFPMCSTFKFLLASAVLQRVDRHLETLNRANAIPPKPLLFNSPLTEPHAGDMMTVAALCATMLAQIGGVVSHALS
jgi:beta-lactamase class A